MNILHVNSITLTTCVSVVVSGDFFRFGLLYHHCYSCQKTKSRVHTPISTVVHAEVVCAPKILPIGIFLSHILRSKIIALWDMSQYQNSPRISLETSVFYQNFQVRFFLAMLWTSKLDTAAEETWYEVNFLSTVSGMVDQCTILTPSPRRHLALIYYPDQIPDSDVKLAKSYNT